MGSQSPATHPSSPTASATTTPPGEPWLETVRRSARDLRYGSVLVTIHAGRVVQIDCTERFRFDDKSTGVSNPAKSTFDTPAALQAAAPTSGRTS